MHAPGRSFDGDLYSWHGWWLSRTFLFGGCMDLVCCAEQHCILLSISVQLGRHRSALGVVHVLCFVCRVGLRNWCLEGCGVFGPSSTLCAGPSFSKHFGGKDLATGAHRVVMDTRRVWLGLIRGLTLISRHYSPSLTIVYEFNLVIRVKLKFMGMSRKWAVCGDWNGFFDFL